MPWARCGRELRRGQVFPLNPFTGLLGFLGSRDHLVPASGLRRLIARHIERKRLERLELPLHVVAVDVVTGEELRLSNGPAIDAVMASAPIPAGLPPVTWDDRELMDGGVANKRRSRTRWWSFARRRSTSFPPGTRALSRSLRAAP